MTMEPAKTQRRQEKRRQHDPVYRRIFNRAQMIEEILRRFATGPWAAHLDYSTLAPVPADFMAKYLKKYEADIIWRVRYGPKKGDWFFVFVLMELQSSAPRFMALRLLGYVIQLCETLLEHGKYLPARRPRRLLPPVLPVVLYNGEKPWTAPLSLAELFQPMDGYTPPDFRYVVLDVNRYPPEELRPVEDVTSGVFLMEQSKDVADLELVLDELKEVVDDPGLARDIALLVSDVANKLELREEEIPRFENLEEVRMSLLQRAEKWTQQWKAEGMAEGEAKGLAKGEAKGRRLGMAKTLKNQAECRFGDLPDWAVDRIDRADVDTLERWSYRVLDATVLEGIFRDGESTQE
jgi:predicted transposase YdaD